MPYILFNTHHWQRASDRETPSTTLLQDVRGHACNRSSVGEGQHVAGSYMLTTVKQKVSAFELVFAVLTKSVSLSVEHTSSLSFLQTTTSPQTLCFRKSITCESRWIPKHLSALFFFFFFFWFFEKTQWTKWIVNLREQAAGRTCVSTMLHLFSGSLSLSLSLLTFPFSCPSHKHPCDLQTHQSQPVSHPNTNARQQTSSKPTKFRTLSSQMWKLKF